MKLKKYKGLRWDVITVKGSMKEGQWFVSPEDDLNEFMEKNNIQREDVINILYEGPFLVMYYWGQGDIK